MQPITDIDLLNRKLSEVAESLFWLMPEMVLAGMLILLLLIDLIAGRRGVYWLIIFSALGFLLHATSLFLQWQALHPMDEPLSILGMLRIDGMSVYFRGLFSVAGLLTVLLIIPYQNAGFTIRGIGELYILLMGLLLGASLMVLSGNLLMLYLSIEVVSISSYILTNFNFDKKSAEAGIKYLLFGGVASGLMLYGMSLLYGFSGTLLIDNNLALAVGQLPFIPVALSLLLLAGGLLFKISAIPFHIWAPDVYEGAPAPVVALFSVVPKLAGVAVLLNLSEFLDDIGEQLPALDWQWVAAVLAIVTIVVGNFAALSQRDAKRMMAYSSIAHSGFLLVGVVAFSGYGERSVLFYASMYLLMNFVAFLLIILFERIIGNSLIVSYRGLGRKFPLLGSLALLVMVSLTGLPPTAGFTAKLLIFSSLWQTYQASESTIMALLLLVGLLNTVVSLFYYLKIPYFMFFKEEHKPEKNRVPALQGGKAGGEVLAGFLVLLLLLGFFQAGWVLDMINLFLL